MKCHLTYEEYPKTRFISLWKLSPKIEKESTTEYYSRNLALVFEMA